VSFSKRRQSPTYFEGIDSRIIQANRTAMRIVAVRPEEMTGLLRKSLVP
jgi:hypothetical protein